jgi:anaerobic selenocysteine-containing dehydrogenase
VIHDVLMPSVMCQYTGAVLAPAAERRPMWWAFAELGRRIGVDVFPDLDLGTASDDDALDLALQGARLGLDDLRRAGEAGQPVETDRAVFGWVHERVLRDGRWRLAPPELVRQLDEVRHPAQLVLIPQRQVRHQNTQHRRLGDRPYVQINPVDAAAVDIADGDQVVVSSATGSVTAAAFVTDAIRVGAVSIPHGWADPCVNTLVSDRDVDSLTGMPRQSGTPVALAREAAS